MKKFLHNLTQLAIAIDQLFNVLIGMLCGYKAYSDETLSAKAYRLELERGRTWARKLIDGILFFDKDHCKESYESEILRRQLPPSMRQ